MEWIEIDSGNPNTFPPMGRLVLAIDMKENPPVADLAIYYGGDIDDWESYTGQIEIPTHWCAFPKFPKKEDYVRKDS